MSSFPTIRPARDSNDISTTAKQGALRCSQCDHEVTIAEDSLPAGMSGQTAPHEQLQEPLAPPHQQPRQEAAHAEPMAASHTLHLVFPFKHRLEQGWRIMENETVLDLTSRAKELRRLFPEPEGASSRKGRMDVEPAQTVLGHELFMRLAGATVSGGKPRGADDTAPPEGSPLPVWRPESITLSEDLHPFIKNMLGVQPLHDEATCQRKGLSPAEHYRFSLEPRLLELINARLPRPASERGAGQEAEPLAGKAQGNGALTQPLALDRAYGLAIALESAVALRRLGVPQGTEAGSNAPSGKADGNARALLLGVRIASAGVYLSRTRYGQLDLELQMQLRGSKSEKVNESDKEPVPVEVLAEALHALGRATKQGYRCARFLRLDAQGGLVVNDKGKPVSPATFTLRELALSLIAPLLEEPPRWERLFTYAAVVLDGSRADDSEIVCTLAKRLARRQTLDYALGERMVGVETIQPFDTVCHAAAIEGGAVVVAPRGVEFLQGFTTNSARSVYLPLALIANREHGALVRLSQEAAIPIEHGQYDQDRIRQLARLRDHLFNFRLAHRFSSVSLISMQNAVFEIWRRTLDTERLLKEVNEDVLSAVAYMSAARRDRFERQFGGPALIIATSLAFIATNNATDAALKALRRALCPLEGADCLLFDVQVWSNLAAYLPATVGLVFAAVVLGIGFHRRRCDIGA